MVTSVGPLLYIPTFTQFVLGVKLDEVRLSCPAPEFRELLTQLWSWPGDCVAVAQPLILCGLCWRLDQYRYAPPPLISTTRIRAAATAFVLLLFRSCWFAGAV